MFREDGPRIHSLIVILATFGNGMGKGLTVILLESFQMFQTFLRIVQGLPNLIFKEVKLFP